MAAITIRPAQSGDHAYLVDNFAKSYKHSGYCGGTSTEVLRRLIEPLLAQWTAIVATPCTDPTFILAWLLYRDANTVGWVHTRPDVRKKGIARQLLAHAEVSKGTIATPFMPTKLEGTPGAFSSIAREHGYDLRFRPYLPVQIALEIDRALQGVAP